jgi:hypothetical protein
VNGGSWVTIIDAGDGPYAMPFPEQVRDSHGKTAEFKP